MRLRFKLDDSAGARLSSHVLWRSLRSPELPHRPYHDGMSDEHRPGQSSSSRTWSRMMHRTTYNSPEPAECWTSRHEFAYRQQWNAVL